MTYLSWVALHGMSHRFTGLYKLLCHDKAMIHEGAKREWKMPKFKVWPRCFLIMWSVSGYLSFLALVFSLVITIPSLRLQCIFSLLIFLSLWPQEQMVPTAWVIGNISLRSSSFSSSYHSILEAISNVISTLELCKFQPNRKRNFQSNRKRNYLQHTGFTFNKTWWLQGFKRKQ